MGTWDVKAQIEKKYGASVYIFPDPATRIGTGNKRCQSGVLKTKRLTVTRSRLAWFFLLGVNPPAVSLFLVSLPLYVLTPAELSMIQ